MIDKPFHTLPETRESFEHSRLEYKCCIKRNEADKAAHGQLDRVSGPKLDDIIIHAIFLVPKAELVISRHVCHSVGDKDEVLRLVGDMKL